MRLKMRMWITGTLVASLALPMLMTLGGCIRDRHNDRDYRDRGSDWRAQNDNDRRDDHRDADRHDERQDGR